MDNQGGSKARVGFVIFIAMLLVMGGVYLVQGGLFGDYTRYQALFPSTTGLRPDARVYVSGVPAGIVKDIDFSEDLEEPKIVVTLLVQSKFAERIREDSMAWIQSEGLLGDKSVSIMPGNPVHPRVAEGGVIRAVERSAMADILPPEVVSGTSDLLENMIKLLKEVNTGTGTLGQILRNPLLYDNLNRFTQSLSISSDELSLIARDLKGMIADVREQKGVLGKLIYSEEYAGEITHALKSASGLMASIQKAMEPIAKGEGTLGRLVHDEDLYRSLQSTAGKLASASERLDSSLQALAENRSVLARMLVDRDLGERMERLVGNLERGSESLVKVLAKVESGEGSLGMLVNDPSYAASLRDLFLGVSEGGFLLNIARRAEETGRAIRFRDEREAIRAAQEENERRRREGEKDLEGKAVPATAPNGGSSPAPAPLHPSAPGPQAGEKAGDEPGEKG